MIAGVATLVTALLIACRYYRLYPEKESGGAKITDPTDCAESSPKEKNGTMIHLSTNCARPTCSDGSFDFASLRKY
jgi:hypothetical protein